MNKTALNTCGSAFALGWMALAAPASAQTVDQVPATEEAPAEEIVVTGVARAANRLDSSISVSAIGAQAIAEAAPRSAAELFRSLPGIRSESSGGEGNANIQMRGIPISTGGAKFLQIQEDGLPVLEFGDIAFGNADIFMRIDGNIARVEAVRGGSASTFASNSPGGIINLISKTGDRAGGAVQASVGVDYGEYRVDGDYGGALGENLTFHVGGFYRQGEGPRRAGYDGNKGGQIRGNITRTFSGGFFRVNFKYLNDRAIAYMPSAVRVTGSNASPTWTALPGLSPQNDAIQSVYFTRAVGLDGANNRVTDDIRDGMHPVVKALGFEFEDEFAKGWTVNNKFRYADISGRFIAPFTATVDTVQNLSAAIGGTGATAVYANGPSAGQAVSPSANAFGIVLFNTKLNALDNITNDLRLSHAADLGGGKLDLSVGFYKSRQKIDMDWTWSSYLLEAKGDNAALINVKNAAGALQTDNGLIAYGASFFGDCCRRTYKLTFDTNAPYAQLSWNSGALTLDSSLRYDFGHAGGYVAGDGGVSSYDVDGNGTISVPETKTTLMPLTARRPVNYDYHYWSYSVGANYRIGADLSVFARYSRGGRANADRYVFGGNTSAVTGALLPGARPVDFVRQAEAGVKYQTPSLQLYATGFWARTEEQNYEATTQKSTAKTYRAYGLELEGNYRSGGFTLAASGTLTSARILASNTAAEVGHRPRRQAEFTYRVSPSYSAGMFSLGASLVGTTSSYTQDDNQLKMPGYTVVNAFVTVRPVERVSLSLSANNLFDVAGYTEAEEGSIPANGIVRARSINGRTLLASLRYDF
ncbi:TonB-dependent receptor [Novosphingobium flavum]|uniref:TonB-dependent receptor n=1 Tax=Novosphingobium flavum TaxID=1778672 RepID=A0A7X1FS28_9SPHN|nr:TonB-dependent receptor [Novosphingobium flavum]MBC2665929.1 TonB-dependent receptor [Novosphingobium flavum]